jgi:hypothetical protein
MSTSTIPPQKPIVSAQKPADEATQANFSLALVDKVDTVLKPFADLASQGIKVSLIGIGGFIIAFAIILKGSNRLTDVNLRPSEFIFMMVLGTILILGAAAFGLFTYRLTLDQAERFAQRELQRQTIVLGEIQKTSPTPATVLIPEPPK